MTLSDFLMKMLTTPGAVWWPLFIILFGLFFGGIYVGWSTNIIRKTWRCVTAEQLENALLKFSKELTGIYVTIDDCKLIHGQNAIPLNEHEELRANQRSVMARLERVEKRVLNGD